VAPATPAPLPSRVTHGKGYADTMPS
jgi:hypothetical protein